MRKLRITGPGERDLLRPLLLTLLYKEIREDSFGEMSFKRHFFRGENESIMIGLRAALGLGLHGVGGLGLN